jgi:hypothetical protein
VIFCDEELFNHYKNSKDGHGVVSVRSDLPDEQEETEQGDLKKLYVHAMYC